MAEEISNCERRLIRDGILENERLDGRSLRGHRQVSIEFGPEEGVVITAFGKTRVLARLSYELSVPSTTRPFEGSTMIELRISPIASRLSALKRGEAYRQLKRQLEQSIRRCCVDNSLLCVVPHKAVWKLTLMLTILNDDGNVCSCSNLAALLSLMSARLPVVYHESDEPIRIIPVDEREPENIRLQRRPMVVCFGLIEQSWLIDPRMLEEQSCDNLVTVSITEFGEINSLSMLGSTGMQRDQISQLTAHAVTIAKHLTNIVRESLKFLAANRKKLSWIDFKSTPPEQEDHVHLRLNEECLPVAQELTKDWSTGVDIMCQNIETVVLQDDDGDTNMD